VPPSGVRRAFLQLALGIFRILTIRNIAVQSCTANSQNGHMEGLATTPEPPYYAVIFTTIRNEHAGDGPDDGYEATAAQMLSLAARQPGFLGVDTARDGVGITVSYWTDTDAIEAWKRQADHAFAQYEGRTRWYARYEIRVARVERASSFVRAGS
jgi:heme-degrading monooxygenase HmoA